MLPFIRHMPAFGYSVIAELRLDEGKYMLYRIERITDHGSLLWMRAGTPPPPPGGKPAYVTPYAYVAVPDR